MIYFKDFKLYKDVEDTGYIVMQVNGSPDLECWLNNEYKLIVEPEGFCSCNVFINIEDLKEGENTILINDLYCDDVTSRFLEVIINDKNAIQ